jgi:hypothetical protein
MGGAARFRTELYDYLARTKRHGVQVIGGRQRLNSAWWLRREIAGHP